MCNDTVITNRKEVTLVVIVSISSPSEYVITEEGWPSATGTKLFGVRDVLSICVADPEFQTTKTGSRVTFSCGEKDLLSRTWSAAARMSCRSAFEMWEAVGVDLVASSAILRLRPLRGEAWS